MRTFLQVIAALALQMLVALVLYLLTSGPEESEHSNDDTPVSRATLIKVHSEGTGSDSPGKPGHLSENLGNSIVIL